MNPKQLKDLREKLKADRLERQLTWKAYAALLQVAESTVNKICREYTARPHETTVAKIEKRLAELKAADEAKAAATAFEPAK